MKNVIGMIAVALMTVSAGISASVPDAKDGSAQMVITVLPASGSRPESLEARDLTVLQGNTRASVVHLQRLAGDSADMELFVLLA